AVGLGPAARARLTRAAAAAAVLIGLVAVLAAVVAGVVVAVAVAVAVAVTVALVITVAVPVTPTITVAIAGRVAGTGGVALVVGDEVRIGAQARARQHAERDEQESSHCAMVPSALPTQQAIAVLSGPGSSPGVGSGQLTGRSPRRSTRARSQCHVGLGALFGFALAEPRPERLTVEHSRERPIERCTVEQQHVLAVLGHVPPGHGMANGESGDVVESGLERKRGVIGGIVGCEVGGHERL